MATSQQGSKPSAFEASLDNYFGLTRLRTNVRTEAIAGLTTFLTMAYIIFVNPAILANAGMDKNAVFVATCLAAAVATLVMGLYANYPIALAPGMGLNAFFAFTIVLTYKFTWQQALAAVFLSGVLFLLISVFRIREYIINAIPYNMKLAISAGVGLFLGIIALEQAKIVVDHPATLVTLGSLKDPMPVLCLFGFVLIAALNHRKILGGTLIGILVVTLIGIPFGLVTYSGIVSMPPSLAPTFLKFDFSRTFELSFIIVVLTLLLVDLFDNAGTLIGVTHRSGLLDSKGPAPAHASGADLRQLRRHVRLGDRHLDHDELHRELGRRRRRRPYRLDRGVRRDPVPAGAVLRALGEHDPGLRLVGGAAVRRLPHGARPCRDGLEGHHRIRAGGDLRRRHAAHLLDRDRHRARLPHLCGGEDPGRPQRGGDARGDRHRHPVRHQVRGRLTQKRLAGRRGEATLAALSLWEE